MLAADELGQVLLFLRFGAVALDLIDAQIAVRTIRQTHAGRCARNFFHGYHVRQVAHVGTAISFGHRDAQHTHLTHLAPQVHGKLIGAIDFCSARRNLCLRKIAHRVAQRINVFTKLKIKAGHVHAVFLQIQSIGLRHRHQGLLHHSAHRLFALCIDVKHFHGGHNDSLAALGHFAHGSQFTLLVAT
jgi:hypothetical protein